MSKHKIRKSLRYGDKAAYFEWLHGNIMTRWRSRQLVRSAVNNDRFNVSRDFIEYVRKKHPENLRDIERLVDVQVNLMQAGKDQMFRKEDKRGL